MTEVSKGSKRKNSMFSHAQKIAIGFLVSVLILIDIPLIYANIIHYKSGNKNIPTEPFLGDVSFCALKNDVPGTTYTKGTMLILSPEAELTKGEKVLYLNRELERQLNTIWDDYHIGVVKEQANGNTTIVLPSYDNAVINIKSDDIIGKITHRIYLFGGMYLLFAGVRGMLLFGLIPWLLFAFILLLMRIVGMKRSCNVSDSDENSFDEIAKRMLEPDEEEEIEVTQELVLDKQTIRSAVAEKAHALIEQDKVELVYEKPPVTDNASAQDEMLPSPRMVPIERTPLNIDDEDHSIPLDAANKEKLDENARRLLELVNKNNPDEVLRSIERKKQDLVNINANMPVAEANEVSSARLKDNAPASLQVQETVAPKMLSADEIITLYRKQKQQKTASNEAELEDAAKLYYSSNINDY